MEVYAKWIHYQVTDAPFLPGNLSLERPSIPSVHLKHSKWAGREEHELSRFPTSAVPLPCGSH